MDGAARHRPFLADDGQHQWAILATGRQSRQTIDFAIGHELGHQFSRGGDDPSFVAFADDIQPPALDACSVTLAVEATRAARRDL